MSNSSSYLQPFATTTNLEAQAIALPIFSSLGIAIIIIPFVWHYRNKNLAACTLFAYLIVSNLFTCINAIIWPNEDYASWWDGTGLCDIQAKIAWPILTGIPCSVCCMLRNLAKVLRIDRANLNTTKKQRRRMLLVDCLICFLVPFLQLALHYCIQPNRYILEAIGGCTPSFDESWPTIVLMYIPPQISALAACYYSVLIIIRLRRYRTQFADILEASNSNLNASRFLRLFLVSFAFVLVYTPVSFYIFYVNLNITWYPYSWSFIHDESWNSVTYLPFLGVRTLDRWLLIVLTFFMFFFFGMGSDAVDIYRAWLTKMGFARIWPSLALPRSRQGSTSSNTSLISRLSLVTRAKKYFNERASRKGSQGELSSTATTNTHSRSGSQTLSLHNQKSSFSTTTSENTHLSGSTLFTDTQTRGHPTTARRPILSVVNEHPSSKIPDFNNPFAYSDPEAQQQSSFPGLSSTATSRGTGGVFSGHQGSPFNFGNGFRLPSMKFSPMNLFPSIGKRWSRATTATTVLSPMPEMKLSPALVGVAKPHSQSPLDLASQYRKGVFPGLKPGWGGGDSPKSPRSRFDKGINPLHSNPSLSHMHFPLPTTSQLTGLQTNIYSSRSRSPKSRDRERERIGSVASDDSIAQSEIEKGVIQVRRKMEREVEGGGGVRILKRDSLTGGVYEE